MQTSLNPAVQYSIDRGQRYQSITVLRAREREEGQVVGGGAEVANNDKTV